MNVKSGTRDYFTRCLFSPIFFSLYACDAKCHAFPRRDRVIEWNCFCPGFVLFLCFYKNMGDIKLEIQIELIGFAIFQNKYAGCFQKVSRKYLRSSIHFLIVCFQFNQFSLKENVNMSHHLLRAFGITFLQKFYIHNLCNFFFICGSLFIFNMKLILNLWRDLYKIA